MADEIQETRCALCQPKVSADCFPGWAGGKIVKILNWNLIGLAPQKIKKDEPHCQIYFFIIPASKPLPPSCVGGLGWDFESPHHTATL